MNIYCVYNGYTGFTDVSVTVLAHNEEQALQLAKDEFKAYALNTNHTESYWNNLKAEFLGEFVNKPCVLDSNCGG